MGKEIVFWGKGEQERKMLGMLLLNDFPVHLSATPPPGNYIAVVYTEKIGAVGVTSKWPDGLTMPDWCKDKPVMVFNARAFSECPQSAVIDVAHNLMSPTAAVS